jgi:hypothetical protein
VPDQPDGGISIRASQPGPRAARSRQAKVLLPYGRDRWGDDDLPMKAEDKVRERKVCEAIVRVLEVTESAARSGGFSPEDPPYQAAENERVDWVATVGNQKFAIEATQVQAMCERIEMSEHLKGLCEPIALALDGTMPAPHIYELVVQPGALSNIRNKQLPAICDHLLQWVRKVAPTLAATPSNHFAREKPTGVGFEVTLYRLPRQQSAGSLRWAYAMPEDWQQEQRTPVREAMCKKLPKLCQWRAEGAVAVLAVWTNDIALSDEHMVAELFVSELRSRGICLDWHFRLFIIDTAVCQWTVYAVRSTEQQEACIDEVGIFSEFELTEVA